MLRWRCSFHCPTRWAEAWSLPKLQRFFGLSCVRSPKAAEAVGQSEHWCGFPLFMVVPHDCRTLFVAHKHARLSFTSGKCAFLPRFSVHPQNRAVFWKLALIGELDVVDFDLFCALLPESQFRSLFQGMGRPDFEAPLGSSGTRCICRGMKVPHWFLRHPIGFRFVRLLSTCVGCSESRRFLYCVFLQGTPERSFAMTMPDKWPYVACGKEGPES